MPYRLLSPLAMLMMLLLVSACSMTNRQPRYHVPEPMQIETFKRFATTANRDYYHVFSKKAYDEVRRPLKTKGMSASQLDVLERHGQPDYTRESFKATTGELVDEWAWWDRKIVTQFVQNELVWEGPLTDMDAYRIRFGHPRRAQQQAYERGARRDFWEYQGFDYNSPGMIVTFTDESLVSRQEF